MPLLRLIPTVMELTTLWFALIAVLFIGYFVLEGFDFGVGILLPFIAKNEAERRTVVTTLGPVWDGNEVWLVLGGGALFAAFPIVYASLFSGFYLAMMLVLLVLIMRTVAIEFRSKDAAITELARLRTVAGASAWDEGRMSMAREGGNNGTATAGDGWTVPERGVR